MTRIRAQTESGMKKKVLFVMALVCILALGACLLAACNQEQTPTVTNAIINEAGELVLIYSDGSAQNLGVITGAQGPQGEQGEQGEQGIQGEQGVSVTGAEINEKGELILSFSDGRTQNLGVVTGAQGPQGDKGDQGDKGEQGIQGVSVTGAEINDKGELILSYSDGRTQNLGVVTGAQGPQGDKGDQGDKGEQGEQGKPGLGITGIRVDGTFLVIEFSDGTFTRVDLTPALTTSTLSYEPLSDGSLSVTGVAGDMQTVVIPSAYLGKPVTEIADGAFQNNTGIISVTIAEGVERIGENAFSGCTSLKAVTIPNSIEQNGKANIASTAFDGASDITSATLPLCAIDSIPQSKLENLVLTAGTELADGALSGCTALCSLTLPNTLRTLHVGAIEECPDLTRFCVDKLEDWLNVEITGFNTIKPPILPQHDLVVGGEVVTDLVIPEGVTEVGQGLFAFSTISTATIAADAETVGLGAFICCYSLNSVTIGSKVTTIGDYAFQFDKAIKEVHITDINSWLNIDFGSSDSNPCYYGGSLFIDGEPVTDLTIPDSVSSIKDHAFNGCASLENVSIPGTANIGNSAFRNCIRLTSVSTGNGVESIGAYAFADCSNLTSVTIPDGVTSIGNGAFADCTGLTSITIPDSVTSIRLGAFDGCSNLTSIYYTGDMTSWLEKDWHDNVMSSGRTLYISGNKMEGAITVPYGVTAIPSDAFAYQTDITSVTIPDGVTSIGSFAFRSCSNLVSVTIPDSVTSIGHYAFYQCTSLTSVSIPDSVTEIGSNAFSGCSELTSVTIPDGVTVLNTGVFSHCSKLTSVSIPSSVTEIGHSVFWGCTGLTTITIPENVRSIGYNTFYECSNLTTITIPASVTYIGNHAFFGCDSLTSATFGVKEGWSTDDTEIELTQEMFSDPSTAAEVLRTGSLLYRSAE